MTFWLTQLKKRRNKLLQLAHSQLSQFDPMAITAHFECKLTCQNKRSAKQEKWDNRETELIQTAHELVDKFGFANLTMDKLVAASVYSKGTIYKHFSCKEDLLVALGQYAIDLNLELMQKALQFNGSPREKSLALHFAYQLYSRLEPALFLCAISTKTPVVMEKASPERLKTLHLKEQLITQICDQPFEQGLSDSSLPANSQVAELSLASWAMSFGTNLLMNNAKDMLPIERLAKTNVLLTHVNLLHDGMNWQPLSNAYNYQQTWLNLEDFFQEYIHLISESSKENKGK